MSTMMSLILNFLISPQAVEAAFSNGVDLLCQTYIAQRAEVAPEMQLIRASVSFGLYVKKSCTELKNQIRRAMTAFLNRRVGTWVTKQGGWVRKLYLFFALAQVQLLLQYY